MDPKEFKKAMTKIKKDLGADLEACHGEMDNLMLKVLTKLGYRTGVKVFNDTEKWYS